MTCEGPFWKKDHIPACYQQRYVQLYPTAVLLACTVAISVSAILPKLRFHWHSSRREAPLLVGDDESSLQTTLTEGSSSASSQLNISFNPKETLYEKPENRSNDDAMVIIRGRTIADKLRLLSELVLVVGELLIASVAWVTTDVGDFYDEYAPNLPFLIVLQALYLVLLVAFRVLNMNRTDRIPAHPFTQCAVLYTATMFIDVIVSYNAYMKNSPDSYQQISAALLVGSILRWVILFSSPVGDIAPRIYTVPGIEPSREPTSSLFRIFACSWNTEMIFRASKQPVESNDIWELREKDHAYHIVEYFANYMPNRSLYLRLAWAFKESLFINQMAGIIGGLLGLLPTVFVNLILRYIEDPNTWPRQVAYLMVFGLFVVYMVHNAINQQTFYYGRRASIQVRASLMSLIYRKALFRRVATANPEMGSDDEGEENTKDEEEDSDDDTKFNPNNTGAVINLMSVDTFKIAEFCAYMHYPTTSACEIMFSVYLLYTVLGVSTFAGCIMMVITMWPNYISANKQSQIQEDMMAVTDKRIERTNEAVSAIRIIKFFAWEHRFSERIMELRRKELKLLLSRYLWWALTSGSFFLIPLLTTLTTFCVYVKYEGKALTPSVAFTAIAIFNILRYPLLDIAQTISRVMSAKVSLSRIAIYLEQEETPKYTNLNPQHPRGPSSPHIGFEKATLSWDTSGEDSSAFKLRNIDLSFVPGDVNVIIGPTGSGKTSLLLGLLGEMTIESGLVWLPNAEDRRSVRLNPATNLTDTVAYCPQQAWLVNDSLRNNILFAAPFNQERYDQVLDACELRRDLEILRDGDKTMIGDKGIALSGGQKQRVSLARAMYSNSRHLILDDCLSAVDSHTAEALYSNAITGPIAANRTIILVSHNVALTIAKAAQVIVMDNGRITAVGPPEVLSASGALGEDELVLKNARESTVSRSASTVDLVKAHKPTAEEIVEHAIEDHTADGESGLEEESRGLGSIPLATYKEYAKALGPMSWWILVSVGIVSISAGQYLQAYWLRHWTGAEQEVASVLVTVKTAIVRCVEPAVELLQEHGLDEDTARSLTYYAGIYGGIGLLTSIASGCRDMILFQGSVRASRVVFQKLLNAIMRAKINFFDSTPAGRIMNRFSKDIEGIDQELIATIDFFAISFLESIVVTIVISFVTPQILPVAVIVCAVFYLVGKLYLAVSQELKRHESVTRSPIFQQFGETLSGAVSIRAYSDARRFMKSNMNAIDVNHRPYLYLWMSNRWLSFYSVVISMTICVSTSFFIVYNSSWLPAGMAGISLSYAMMFGDSVLWVVRMYAEVVIYMNSMERVKEYIDIEPEAAEIIPESRPPANWPSKGEIEVKELSLRYADNLPEVIKKVSFHIEGGLKVGIVGRTGAGKSTIITALFRLLEPAHGSIVIDGVDISTIGLHDLRSRLAIIPQDPTLFVGTLRSNLDPFDEYTDDQILAALARVKLVPEDTTAITAAEAVALASANAGENINQFLDLASDVQEGGSNLSQGQRQLVCLARSLLKSPQIMLLDEATASIDYDTDAMIQTTIREQFNNVTILTIAHRLRTIADYDRIIVLEMGELSQFGSPAELLDDKEGIFYSMCEKSGELDALMELAHKAKK
ncbi:ATP-dependent bile acid permease [Wickerhamiella sorbophila]|uniref:ATP-dependent bile acid permease n=1 Tax=Wickerhamiella sorbophila TaxID=45607 RepID=A0A2T0FEV8_9ASCO|nr:ATP-dependent bile acid permease [Wickerhamiella sorbophila]PRT53528.1 ATP-dependent bile acid permease [Wickerhamiella sorbophila]